MHPLVTTHQGFSRVPIGIGYPEGIGKKILNLGRAMYVVMSRKCDKEDLLTDRSFLEKWRGVFGINSHRWGGDCGGCTQLTFECILEPVKDVTREDLLYAMYAEGNLDSSRYTIGRELSEQHARMVSVADAMRFDSFISVLETILTYDGAKSFLKILVTALLLCVVKNINLCGICYEVDVQELIGSEHVADVPGVCSTLLFQMIGLIHERCRDSLVLEEWDDARDVLSAQSRVVYKWSRWLVEKTRREIIRDCKLEISIGACGWSIEAARRILLSSIEPVDTHTANFVSSNAHRNISVPEIVVRLMMREHNTPAAQMPVTLKRDAYRIHQHVPFFFAAIQCFVCLYTVHSLAGDTLPDMGLCRKIVELFSKKLSISEWVHQYTGIALGDVNGISWNLAKDIVKEACASDDSVRQSIVSGIETIDRGVYYALEIRCIEELVESNATCCRIEADYLKKEEGCDKETCFQPGTDRDLDGCKHVIWDDSVLSVIFAHLKGFRDLVFANVDVYYLVYSFYLQRMRLPEIRRMCA